MNFDYLVVVCCVAAQNPDDLQGPRGFVPLEFDCLELEGIAPEVLYSEAFTRELLARSHGFKPVAAVCTLLSLPYVLPNTHASFVLHVTRSNRFQLNNVRISSTSNIHKLEAKPKPYEETKSVREVVSRAHGSKAAGIE